MSINDLVVFEHHFEGIRFPTLYYEGGRPCWFAPYVGRILGYGQDGERLVTRIIKDWSGEFVAGQDYVLVSAQELMPVRRALRLTIADMCDSLLLFESGLHIVLAKTNKPVSRRLRTFLADKVMPRLSGEPLDVETKKTGQFLYSPKAQEMIAAACAEELGKLN